MTDPHGRKKRDLDKESMCAHCLHSVHLGYFGTCFSEAVKCTRCSLRTGRCAISRRAADIPPSIPQCYLHCICGISGSTHSGRVECQTFHQGQIPPKFTEKLRQAEPTSQGCCENKTGIGENHTLYSNLEGRLCHSLKVIPGTQGLPGPLGTPMCWQGPGCH